jgi:RNA polymerase sigma-70 factor (ECF subfamily)
LTDLDDLYRRTQGGDVDAFTEWVRRVEPALRGRLRPFARHVDVEAVIQEALLRMWRLAPTLELTGANASLRYLGTIARNLALAEARAMGAEVPLENPEGETIEIPVPPAPVPDKGLRAAILGCLEALRGSPARAIGARLSYGERPDRELAAEIAMTLNTFLQNVVRARRALAECLKGKGIVVTEMLR